MDSWFFLPFPRYVDTAITGPEEAKNPAGKSPPPDSDPFSDAEVWKKSAGLPRQIADPLTTRMKSLIVWLNSYGLFNAVCGAGLITSSWALTFCRPAASTSICFC